MPGLGDWPPGNRPWPGPPAELMSGIVGMSREESIRAAALAAAVEFVTSSTLAMTVAAAVSENGVEDLALVLGSDAVSIPAQAKLFQRFIESGEWDA